MANLTKKQKQIFDFVNSYISENGISPTLEEIKKKLGLKAVSTVHEHLSYLKNKGYLKKDNNSIRNIVAQKEIRSIVDIPIIGTIAAGQPIEAIENHQGKVSLSDARISDHKNYYAL